MLPEQLCYSRRLLTFPLPFRTRKYYILRDSEGVEKGGKGDGNLERNFLRFPLTLIYYRRIANNGRGGGERRLQLYLEEGELEKLVNTKFSGDERGEV